MIQEGGLASQLLQESESLSHVTQSGGMYLTLKSKPLEILLNYKFEVKLSSQLLHHLIHFQNGNVLI